ncbi:MAG: glycosyltransferase [Flavobacteriales bacterium]|nr:glycosyltransferase [Flavobacteriales bacterium]
MKEFEYRPMISVVMPVYNAPVELLDAAIRSVRAQVYPDWELCIADDRSTHADVRRCLEHWRKEDPRIKVEYRARNGHISEASNSALHLATGEFCALMDHDDLLAPDALYHGEAVAARSGPGYPLLGRGQDRRAGSAQRAALRPQWCPDHLLSRNYFGHLVVARTQLLREVGGFRLGFEGSQDHDLLLRITERTGRIAHIPRVLYHWRIHAGSAARSEEVKPYAYEAARRAITEACERRGEPAHVSFLDGFRGYGIRFKRPLEGRVSIIIPTKDKAEILGTCLRSLFGSPTTRTSGDRGEQQQPGGRPLRTVGRLPDQVSGALPLVRARCALQLRGPHEFRGHQGHRLPPALSQQRHGSDPCRLAPCHARMVAASLDRCGGGEAPLSERHHPARGCGDRPRVSRDTPSWAITRMGRAISTTSTLSTTTVR